MGRKSKPYATMKDGPDKYLFRKDQKQKLVGSADNEPDEGEVELEEGNDGYEYKDEVDTEFDGNNSKIWHYGKPPGGDWETFERSPYAQMTDVAWKLYTNFHKENGRWPTQDEGYKIDQQELEHYKMNDINEMRRLAGLPIMEDCDESEDAEKNDDGECSPFTHADENVAMVREEGDINDYHEEEIDRYMQLGKRDLWILYNRTESERNPDDHAEIQYMAAALGRLGIQVAEGDVDEDMLVPPQDVEDGAYEDERTEPELDRQTDYDAPDRYDGDDSFDLYDDENTHVGREFASSEFGGEGGNTHVGREFASGEIEEQGPGDDEFAHDDDAMIDIGDGDDYGDDSEDFSDLSGEFYGDSQYYEAIEMNELRKAAGLAIVEADDSFMGIRPQNVWWENDPDDLMSYIYWKKNQLPPSKETGAFQRNWQNIVDQLSQSNPPPADWVNPVEVPEPREQECPQCRGRKAYPSNDEPCSRCDATGKVVESSPDGGNDYDYFDFKDEKGYYLIADEIGDHIIFGMHNEVGVPEQYTDSMIELLRKHGFEKGIDYDMDFANQVIASREYRHGLPVDVNHPDDREVEEDLQNGYNDRAFTDGQDYFPKGSHQSPSDDLGPTASGYGDNAMKNRMRSKEADAVYESMKQEYRRYRKS